MINMRFFLLGLISLIPFEVTYADCISLIRGKVAYDVKTCGRLQPEKTFDMSKDEYSFIRGLSKRDRMQFWSSYRGLILTGKVAKSNAVRSGLNPEKGVLNGENIRIFVSPKDTKDSNVRCADIRGKRLAAFLEEACCEGGGDPPCLLSSAYTLRDIKVMGPIGARSLTKRKPSRQSQLYSKANELFQNRKFLKAVRFYARAYSEKDLDITGLYKWALAYRKTDQCKKALYPLKKIVEKQEKKDFWSDDEPIIRKATFLMARCYAKLNKPEMAAPILEGYLVDPKKYRPEIRKALRHPDFGWIRTSKQFGDFRKKSNSLLK